MKIKDIIFNIKSLSLKETLEYVVDNAQKNDKKTFIVTINTEIIMLARSDSEYEKVLKSAELAVNDSIGVVWGGKIFGKPFKGRVHGVDLVERLSEAVVKKPITVGFLGGQGNVAQKTADCLVKKYPGLKVAFALKEWPEGVRGPAVSFPPVSAPASLASRRTQSALSGSPSSDVTPHKKIINHKSPARHQMSTQATAGGSIINHKMSADILFVAFGSPKQEKWIAENLQNIDVRVAIGVGGAFDFISGKVPRAPFLIRNLGLEWLFRLIIQPWRIKRQVALVRFVFLVIKEKLF